jgi:hypothetical protein
MTEHNADYTFDKNPTANYVWDRTEWYRNLKLLILKAAGEIYQELANKNEPTPYFADQILANPIQYDVLYGAGLIPSNTNKCIKLIIDFHPNCDPNIIIVQNSGYPNVQRTILIIDTGVPNKI